MNTILLVDDNKNIREFCKRELEEEGYQVLLAPDGKDAIKVLKHKLPDLVILDIRMPRMGGLETIQHIMEFETGIPVILYTAHKDDLYFDFTSWSAEACIEKSEDLSELKSTVARLLEHKRQLV
jgi:two-component system, response regulator, stage 0 sporulation protein F